MYAINRLKAAKSAWYWAVHIRRRGKVYFRRFYDLKLGGARKALAAAVQWRDGVLANTRVLTFREFHARRRSNNTSGVPGVHFVKGVRQPLGSWQAKIRLAGGRKVHRSFSVRKFGSRQAFRLAVAARERLLELVADRPFLYSRTAKRFAAMSRARGQT